MIRKIRLFFFLIFSVFLSFGAYCQISTDEELAEMFFTNKEFDKAVIVYEKLINKKFDFVFYNKILDCYFEINDYPKAEKFLKKYIKSSPNEYRFVVDLGYLYEKAGNLEKAKKQFDNIIKTIPPNTVFISNIANAFIYRNKYDYAVETYLKGRKLVKDTKFYEELAELYGRRGDYESMMNEYINLLETSPASMYLVQGKILYLLGNENNSTRLVALQNVLLKRIQANPENSVYSDMLLWISIQKKDFESAFLQSKAIDRRMKLNGEKVYELAQICTSNDNYAIAIKCFEYILSLGKSNDLYQTSRYEMLRVKFKKIISSSNYTKAEIEILEKEYIDIINEFGKNETSIDLIRELTYIQAFYLNKTQQAIDLLNEAVNFTNAGINKTSECKIQLADVMLMKGEVWEASLLYSQVEKDLKYDTLGFNAKFKNAKLSYFIGDFGWAKMQLDVLKASTSKLISNDALQLSMLLADNIGEDSITEPLKMFARGDFLAFQNKNEEALAVFDSVIKTFVINSIVDEAMLRKSEILIKRQQFDSAKTVLEAIIKQYPTEITADDAIFKLAELLENNFNDKTKAMELYQNIFVNYPDSFFSAEARKRFRILRGDLIN